MKNTHGSQFEKAVAILAERDLFATRAEESRRYSTISVLAYMYMSKHTFQTLSLPDFYMMWSSGME